MQTGCLDGVPAFASHLQHVYWMHQQPQAADRRLIVEAWQYGEELPCEGSQHVAAGLEVGYLSAECWFQPHQGGSMLYIQALPDQLQMPCLYDLHALRQSWCFK